MARKKGLSFEAGMEELGLIIEKLSNDTCSLEESMALYEQGMNLHKQLSMILEQQQKKIEMIDPDTGEIRMCEGAEYDV